MPGVQQNAWCATNSVKQGLYFSMQTTIASNIEIKMNNNRFLN